MDEVGTGRAKVVVVDWAAAVVSAVGSARKELALARLLTTCWAAA